MSTWYQNAIVYELYVDKFAGNFRNLTSKLDYFNYLGINTLWLLPFYPSPMIDGGYDISDFQNIRPNLGTLSDFNSFISAAHQKNLKVIIDLVLNHTSIDHPWFGQHPDWYLWADDQSKYTDAFIHFAEIKKSNWIYYPSTQKYYYATFYQEQPDLNWDNPEVEKAMLAVIDFWLDRGVDGFRLDAVARLIKRDGTNCFALPQTHQILKKIRSHIDSKYSDRILLAETGGWPEEAKTFFGQGDQCHSVIHFPLAVRMLSAISSKNPDILSNLWDQSTDIPAGCNWSLFLTNHDTVDLFFLPEDQKHMLHQQIDPQNMYSYPEGQSTAARLSQVCQGIKDDILWATKLLLDQPGTPIIYYGNEIGLPNQNLNSTPSDLRDYVRGFFNWSEVSRQQSDPTSLLNSIRTLIQNRKVQ